MAGYTPLFSSLTTGTLCGKWPDIGLWPIILSMADKHGHVDCTCAYIAGVTGLEVEEVEACMKRFTQPDPGSRSDAAQGARLELLEAHRSWGWRIVNHEKYREKARKAAQQAAYTESGRDAERKRLARVQSRPAVSSAVRPSDADSVSDSDSNLGRGKGSGETPNPQPHSHVDRSGTVRTTQGNGKRQPDASLPRTRGSRLPADWPLDDARRAYAAGEGIAEPSREFARFCDYWRAQPGARGIKLDWDATWRNWCRSAVDRGTSGSRAAGRRLTAAELEARENASK